jgi:ABC-type sugar transport system permease subunit
MPRIKDGMFASALTLPAIILTLAVLGYPLVYSFWLSLHDVSLAGGPSTWVGFDNYKDAIESPLFWPAAWRTIWFTAIVTVLTTVFAFLFALALNRDFPGRNLLRGLMILPWALSQIMLALTFGWIYNSSYGPLNGFLYDTGIINDYVTWFGSGTDVLLLMSLALVWSLAPFGTLLYLGALQTVPDVLHRAARVDGASWFQRMRLITLPWTRGTTLVVVVLAAVNGFISFGPIYLLTGGGPGTETTVLSWLGYTAAFRDFEVGLGAAIFYLMTLMVLAISGAIMLLSRVARRD